MNGIIATVGGCTVRGTPSGFKISDNGFGFDSELNTTIEALEIYRNKLNANVHDQKEERPA